MIIKKDVVTHIKLTSVKWYLVCVVYLVHTMYVSSYNQIKMIFKLKLIVD